MKRFLAAIAVSAMMVLSLGMLAGCGPSDEEVIREALTSELDACVNLDEATVQELSKDMDMTALQSFGIDGIAFMQSYLDGFAYSIDSITVDGSNAEAVVTLTCKSFSDFQAQLESAAAELMADSSLIGASEEELNAKLGAMVMDAVNNTKIAATDPITIEYTKSGSTWTPASSAEQNVASALMTN